MAGFKSRLSPVSMAGNPSERRWEAAFSHHATQLSPNWPVALEPILGTEFAALQSPQAECPPPDLHSASAAGMMLPEAEPPAFLPAAIPASGVPESGVLTHLAAPRVMAAGAAAPAWTGSEEFAPPDVEISAGTPVPPLPEARYESPATIAPEPAERWLSLVFDIEPVLEPPAAQPPRFSMAAEIAECFRDLASGPPPAVDRWMPRLQAEAAERFLHPVSAGNAPAAIQPAIPAFAAAPEAPAPALAAWTPIPAPEAAERLILATASAALVPSALPLAIPRLDAHTSGCAPALAGAIAGPGPEHVESWLDLASAPVLAPGVPEVRTLAFAVPPQRDQIFRDPADAPPAVCETLAPVPAAEPAERWIDPASAPAAQYAIPRLRLQETSVAAAARKLTTAPAARSLAAEPVARWIEPVIDSGFVRAGGNLHVPFALETVTPDILRDPADAPPPIQEVWMRVPAAEPAERWVQPAVAGALAPQLAITTQSLPLRVVEPFVPFIPRFAKPQAAEPAAIFVKPAFSLLPTHPQVVFPPMPHRIGQSVEPGKTHGSLAGASTGLPAIPVESLPSAGKAPIPIRRGPALPKAPAAAALPVRLAPAGVTEIYPAAARSKESTPAATRVKPLETVVAKPPAVPIERPFPRMPEPELYSLEYYCQRGAGSPSRRLGWATPAIPPAALRFQMKPVFETLEEQAPPKPERKKLEIAEIFSLPEARQRSQSSHLGWVGKIAAGIMVMFALWSGSKIASIGRQPQAVARDAAPEARPVDSAPLVARGAEPRTGMMAKLRQAIASRAAVAVQDSFRGGMESWGSGPKALAAGWSRSPDGYVKVGDLALFRPTQTFRDYRLEFYGQIEKKSMGWVMRAKDKQNYYAMKFTVVEPGLRPVIAMVHYPVVGGKKGHKVETPLSVMVHNNTPYHVTVDVKGNHFTAAIEGEEVDSWTDDTPGMGAVGFFSEVGESARLYWAKVTKNQDWIGRFCYYLAGDEASRTAELWNPDLPPPSPAPADPRPHDFVITAAREVNLEENSAPRGARVANNWRIPIWIS